MPKSPQFPIRIFYDGSCSVCAREINHYLQRDHGGKLLGVDISAHDFDPEPFRIPLDLFMYELHVIDQKGETYKGVEALGYLAGVSSAHNLWSAGDDHHPAGGEPYCSSCV